MHLAMKRTDKDETDSINMSVINIATGEFINVPCLPDKEEVFTLSKRVKLGFNNSTMSKISFDIEVMSFGGNPLGEKGFNMEIISFDEDDDSMPAGSLVYFEKVLLPKEIKTKATITIMPHTNFSLKVV